MTIKRINVQTGDVEIIQEDAPSFLSPLTASDVIAERDRRINEGTTINVPGIGDIPVSGSVAVQIDMMAQSQRASILQAEGDTETKILFNDREDVVHQLSADQFQQLFKAGVEWVESVKAKAWALIKMNPTPNDFRDNKYW